MLFNSKDSFAEIWTVLKHELHRGALDSKHPFRYVTLATHNVNSPALRMLVLRDVDEELNFYLFTDSRSDKVNELQENPHAEFLVYHPGRRTQIQVRGNVHIHQQNELSRKMWSLVQGDARKAYNSILSPGSEIESPDLAHEWPDEMDDRYFVVLQFIPDRIEALQLDGLTHLRVRFLKMAVEWEGKWLVP